MDDMLFNDMLGMMQRIQLSLVYQYLTDRQLEKLIEGLSCMIMDSCVSAEWDIHRCKVIFDQLYDEFNI